MIAKPNCASPTTLPYTFPAPSCSTCYLGPIWWKTSISCCKGSGRPHGGRTRQQGIWPSERDAAMALRHGSRWWMCRPSRSTPPPKVDSAVVRMVPCAQSSRRPTLPSWKSWWPWPFHSDARSCATPQGNGSSKRIEHRLRPDRRAEEVPVADYLQLGSARSSRAPDLQLRNRSSALRPATPGGRPTIATPASARASARVPVPRSRTKSRGSRLTCPPPRSCNRHPANKFKPLNGCQTPVRSRRLCTKQMSSR